MDIYIFFFSGSNIRVIVDLLFTCSALDPRFSPLALFSGDVVAPRKIKGVFAPTLDTRRSWSRHVVRLRWWASPALPRARGCSLKKSSSPSTRYATPKSTPSLLWFVAEPGMHVAKRSAMPFLFSSKVACAKGQHGRCRPSPFPCRLENSRHKKQTRTRGSNSTGSTLLRP